MLTGNVTQARNVVREFQEEVHDAARYVDIGVLLHVVERDPNGIEYLPEKPRLRLVSGVGQNPRPFGGVVDTKLEHPRIVGPSVQPLRWFCSVDQLPIVLHQGGRTGSLVEGGMGAGKTTSGIMWTYFRWLEHLGQFREGAIIAPTNERLDVVFKEMLGGDRGGGMFPSSWFKYQSSKHLVTLCDGTRIRGVSTYKQSDAQGSRLQGQNWSWGFADEIQDQVSEFINFMARLRSGREGGSPRYASATSKDDPAYRDLKTKLVESGIWSISRFLGPDSPFIHADHWEAMKSLTTPNEYRRIVLAEDVPSESRVYSCFDRKENIRPIPLGARKITSLVLRKKTGDPRHALLVGHDPGTAKAASVWLDAYDVRGEVHWYVRGELFTLHATVESHAMQAMEITRKRFGCNVRTDAEMAHVRCQPLGAAEDKPDLSVFAIWKRIGFDIRAAQYSKSGQGIGQIKKDSRIGVINTLFCDATGRRRLFIECDDKGIPVAPGLVAALETMERDDRGRAEHEEKDVRHDKSDLPAAMGYALWPLEKELAVALRHEIRKGLC